MTPSIEKNARPLDWSQVSDADQRKIAESAAMAVRNAVTKRKGSPADLGLGLLGAQLVAGVFVSLKGGGRLRGCRGQWGSRMPLVQAIAQSAQQTAVDDPRFPAVTAVELAGLDLQVWVL